MSLRPILVITIFLISQSVLPATTEDYPGGNATYLGNINRDAFTHPLATLEQQRQLDFKLGGALFERLWVSAPSSTQAADGLGPLYNARSCIQCHPRNGRGRPPQDVNDHAVSLVMKLSIPPQTLQQHQLLASQTVTVIPEPTYGFQLQRFAVPGLVAEGDLRVDYDELPMTFSDGETVLLRKPRYQISAPGYGAMHSQTLMSARIAPPMLGLGLLEAIPVTDILAHEDPEDRNGDGISGRANRLRDATTGQVVPGRFGWKAGQTDIDQQTQLAFAHDLGLSVPRHPQGAGECTDAQNHCRAAPHGNSPQYDNLEAHQPVVDLVTAYVRHLTVPARRQPQSATVLAGRKVFYDLDCNQCHVPSYTTGSTTASTATSPALAAQTIWPYSDLLLHDMGEGLADHRPEGQASGREWRTAPLWGIGLTPQVNGHSNFLHDGRARNLLEAILWHGGEATAQRDAALRLNKTDRDNLIHFLESL